MSAPETDRPPDRMPGNRRRADTAWLAARLESTLGILLATLLAAIMALTCVDVVGRYFFNAPVTAGYEITSLAMGVAVYLGLPLATARGEHISVSLFANLFKGRARRVQAALIEAFGAAVLAVFSWRLWIQAEKLAAENFMMMFLDVRVAPFVHAMSVLTGFTVLVLAAQIVLRAAAPSSRETAR